MAHEVTYAHSAMTGAPTLTGQAGSLATILDAVLVDGWGSKTITGIVIAAGVATVTFSGSQTFEPDVAIEVVGVASPAGLNGRQRASAITSNSVSFPTTAADGTATLSSATVKNASLGWAKVYTGTNVRVYQSQSLLSTKMLLRVDDTGTTNARVVGYEAMTDVNTGLRPFPMPGYIAGGGYWSKSYQANTTTRQWFIVGDDRTFYLGTNPGTTTYTSTIHAFGDLVPMRAADPWACAITINWADSTNLTTIPVACVGQSDRANTASRGTFVPRLAGGQGQSINMAGVGAGHIANGAVTSAYSGIDYGIGYFPNASDNGLLLNRLLVAGPAGQLFANAAGHVRGHWPGLLHACQHMSGSTYFQALDKLAGRGEFSGRTLWAARPGTPSSSTFGTCFFDITGPWR